MPETLPNPIPSNDSLPTPTAAYQMLVSWYDGENDVYKWGLLNPPDVADDQVMKFGTTGPYWANVASAPGKSS